MRLDVRYPSILDQTGLPAVFRSARHPRQNHALTGRPRPRRADFLTRIAEIAGTEVAEQIVREFGGRAVSIRKSLFPLGRVYCGDCRHFNVSAQSETAGRCAFSPYVNPANFPRVCHHFTA